MEQAWHQARTSENPNERAYARMRLIVWALEYESRKDYSLWRDISEHVINDCKDMDVHVLTEIAMDCPVSGYSAKAGEKLRQIPEEEREKWERENYH